jgi:hypothetical protein
MEMADSSTQPWDLVLQSPQLNYSKKSPAIDGEKRAHWNWSGRPANEIRVRLFEQQAIFRVVFFSRGKRRKIPRHTVVGQSIII